jgi:transposase
MLFVGDDWAEDHHDVAVINQEGRLLARGRLPEGVQGIEALHGLIADHLDERDGPTQVMVGIETDRGPWVAALLAANYTVFAVNPLQAARYRERHGSSGAKSDKGDALVLAELVRTDHAHHRPITGDSDTAEQVKVLARSHQSLIWARQRQVNVLRSNLREYFPAALKAFGTGLADRNAIAVLAVAPGPGKARKLSSVRVQALLRKAGRSRYLKSRADEIASALQSEQLEARAGIEAAYSVTTQALVAVIGELNTQIQALQEQVEACFGQHPDAEIYLSQPGLGPVLGARVLAEFG